MPHYTYLIVGGGMAADSAVRGIRQEDRSGSIGIVSQEFAPPYDRPPLTKALWKGTPMDEIWRGTDDRDVTLHLDCRVETIDAQKKQVVDHQGETYGYDKLLLATGGTPRRLPIEDEDVVYYRTVNDYKHLRKLTEMGGPFAVIGGGFIGSEISAALAMNNQHVVLIFPEEGIGGRIFPVELSRFLNDYYREKGVEVLPGEMVEGLVTLGETKVVQTKSGRDVDARHVIAGIGIRPNTELAEQAGLKVDNGIVVDEKLRTSDPSIYAAGDVANFYNPALGKRLRVEHEDNANTMGEAAGRSMAGGNVTYDHLPFFYSDLFDLGYEAVGETDSRMETFADWREPFHEGVIYYLKDGRVRGVILWNVWEQVDAARALIAEPGPFDKRSLKGRLPAG